MKYILKIFVVLLIFCGLFFALDRFYLNNEKRVIYKALTTFEKVLDVTDGFKFDKNIDDENGYSAEGNLSININDKDTKDTISLDYVSTSKDDKFLFNGDIKINKKSSISFDFYKNNNNSYFKFDKVFDKYIELNNKNDAIVDGLIYEDYLYIGTFYLENFVKLNTKTFKSDKKTLTIDGEDVKVNESILEYNYDELEKLYNKLNSEAQKDERAKYINKMLKEYFDESLNEEEMDFESLKILNASLSVYTKDILKNIIGLEVKLEFDDKSELFLSYIISDKISIVLKSTMEGEILSNSYIDLYNKDNKSYIDIIEVYEGSQYNINLVSDLINGTLDINLDFLLIDEEESKFNLSGVLNGLSGNDEIKLKLTGSYYENDEKDCTELVVELNNKFTSAKEINEDISESVKLDELSDDQVSLLVVYMLSPLLEYIQL